MSQVNDPLKLNRDAIRIKNRFVKYKKLAWSVGLSAICMYLTVIFIFLKVTAACFSGLYVCEVESLSFSSIVTSLFYFPVVILVIFEIALRIDQLQTFLCDLEKEQLQIVEMQEAYTRNAEIVATTDKVNNTYHSKIYRAVVRDLENIVNK